MLCFWFVWYFELSACPLSLFYDFNKILVVRKKKGCNINSKREKIIPIPCKTAAKAEAPGPPGI
ncbi:hypothetical protein HanPSC8_Chr06g0255681 [Helianthus annuus]|nr:hypothetical protein HanPSC8_Chr06g0255681 [Helianthus annuus]